MQEKDTNSLNIEEKLATLRFICHNKCHITLDIELCKECEDKPCKSFCPARVYIFEENNIAPSIDYENCLECGTCRICCPKGALTWNYPEGASGVSFKFG